MEICHIDNTISNLDREIQALDQIANERILKENEIETRNQHQYDLWMWMKGQETYWPWNAIIKGMRDGD